MTVIRQQDVIDSVADANRQCGKNAPGGDALQTFYPNVLDNKGLGLRPRRLPASR